jgi:heme oxygenase
MTILKDATWAKHREIEKLPLIQTMFEGKFNDVMYIDYLYELKHIYKKIEDLSNEHGITEGMPDLDRYNAICKDMEELGIIVDRDLMPSTIAYLAHLDKLSKENSKLLMAHVYVRHMGDLYGGKLMARVVPGNGYMYQFTDRAGLIKAFNDKLSNDLADEANLGFDYFMSIFTELWDVQINTQ